MSIPRKRLARRLEKKSFLIDSSPVLLLRHSKVTGREKLQRVSSPKAAVQREEKIEGGTKLGERTPLCHDRLPASEVGIRVRGAERKGCCRGEGEGGEVTETKIRSRVGPTCGVGLAKLIACSTLPLRDKVWVLLLKAGRAV